MSKEKFDWLDSANFVKDDDIDWEEVKKNAYITPAWVRNPELIPPEQRERMARLVKEWLK